MSECVEWGGGYYCITAGLVPIEHQRLFLKPVQDKGGKSLYIRRPWLLLVQLFTYRLEISTTVNHILYLTVDSYGNIIIVKVSLEKHYMQ